MSNPPQKPASTSKWGSFLSGAVAGLESRLDTILAEESDASAKARAAEAVVKQAAAEKKKLEQTPSRTPSGRRANGRLQERLAKAVVKGTEAAKAGNRTSSELPSRSASPAVASDVGRSSIDSRISETQLDLTEASEGLAHVSQSESPENGIQGAAQDMLASAAAKESTPPIPKIVAPEEDSRSSEAPNNTSPRVSTDTPSLSAVSSPQTPEAVAPGISVAVSVPATSDTDVAALRSAHREEVNTYLERIDALQSKLAYLSQTLSSQARAAASSAPSDLERQLADKDAQIAALMEEGQNLSKTELKHMTAIKKLRAKGQEADKEIVALRSRAEKAEKAALEASERAKRAEAAEKNSADRLKAVAKIQREVESLKTERAQAELTITELRRSLADATARAEEAEKKAQTDALEGEKRAVAELTEKLEEARIERQLAEDRAKSELKKVKDEAAKQQERADALESELRGEIANLEAKLEVLRFRTEEVSSAGGDSQAKLLRQIETLQTQYALASENWQGIENSLTSRVAALEKERDELSKREGDIRRKAREVNSKARRLEDELESVHDRARTLEVDLQETREAMQKLQARLAQTEKALHDARAEFEREKKIMDTEFQQRLEEERTKWRLEASNPISPSEAPSQYLRTESPSGNFSQQRKISTSDMLGLQTLQSRRGLARASSSAEMSLLPSERPPSRRTSTQPTALGRVPDAVGTPQRQNSMPHSLSSSHLNGASASRTPSLYPVDQDDAFERASSPQRTINDMISVSTVGAGPSVQLVERMSAAVRRLESEKAAIKEELARLTAQRDEAREEVVILMREVEQKRGTDQKVEKLEKDLKETDERYQASLELLGEKSERVEELENDVDDLKKIYRDLVERTMK